MQFLNLIDDGLPRAAVLHEDQVHWLIPHAELSELVRKGHDLSALGREALARGPSIAIQQTGAFAPLLTQPGKIICLGLNYYDHAKEGGRDKPVYPWFFMRSSSSLAGHKQAALLPKVSEQFDFEAEMAVVIGKHGRHVKRENALDLVLGYSCFNDLSVRDYQKKTPQWTIGKNFDGTGPFGPALVLASDLPEGGKGLRIQCRINGRVVQDANTSDMIFDVAETIELLTECMTLEPGDVLVMGTPAGVGFARQPPLWLKDGDKVEVEIERIGILCNPVQLET
ncbi:MAG: fumarylacetoacetate hydrolase family protein [Rhodoferax sp.]